MEEVLQLRRFECINVLKQHGYTAKDVIIRKGKKKFLQVYIKNVHTNLNEIYEICDDIINSNIFDYFEVVKKQ
jgi:hypothetical protein